MATNTSRVRQVIELVVVLLVVGPLLVQWGFLGMDLAPSVGFVPGADADLLVRLAGLALVLLVLGGLVRQKRRARGQQASESAPEEASDRKVEDRRVEGSGEVYAPYAYNNQQAARRESERIRDRAEEIADADRDAYERR